MNKAYKRPWRGRKGVLSIVSASALVFALAACGAETPVTGQSAEEEETPHEMMPVMGPERVILGFGDSLMAGYGLEQDEGYPERLEAVMRTRGINARIIDAGVSGDTTAAGLQRIAFVLDNLDAEPDLAIVELGGNDLLRSISPEQTHANLKGILDALSARDIPVVLMGMRAPPNYGPAFQNAFDNIYPALAEEYDAALVPFFMEPLVADPELLQSDRIHPKAEGVEEMVARTVDRVIGALPPVDEAAQ